MRADVTYKTESAGIGGEHSATQRDLLEAANHSEDHGLSQCHFQHPFGDRVYSTVF